MNYIIKELNLVYFFHKELMQITYNEDFKKHTKKIVDFNASLNHIIGIDLKEELELNTYYSKKCGLYFQNNNIWRYYCNLIRYKSECIEKQIYVIQNNINNINDKLMHISKNINEVEKKLYVYYIKSRYKNNINHLKSTIRKNGSYTNTELLNYFNKISIEVSELATIIDFIKNDEKIIYKNGTYYDERKYNEIKTSELQAIRTTIKSINRFNEPTKEREFNVRKFTKEWEPKIISYINYEQGIQPHNLRTWFRAENKIKLDLRVIQQILNILRSKGIVYVDSGFYCVVKKPGTDR